MFQDHPGDPSASKWVPGVGYTMKTADGRFSLNVRARLQFQYAFQRIPDAADFPTGHSGEFQQNAQVRRGRLMFTGNIFHSSLKYQIQLNIAPADVNMGGAGPQSSIMRDAFILWDKIRDFNIVVGQMKVPWNRERVASSQDLQLVDRSITNPEFNLDRDVGIQIRSKDLGGIKKFAYYAGVFSGEGRDAFAFTDLGLLYVARFEILPLGLFDDYVMSDMTRGTKPRLAIAGSYAFHDNAKRDRGIIGTVPVDGGTTDYHNAQADIHFKVAGFSLLSEFYWRKGSRNGGPAVDDMGAPIPTVAPRNGLGGFVQAGYLIPKLPLEFAARWAAMTPQGSNTSLTRLQEVGPGINWYFARHPLKLQLDYFRTFTDTGIAEGSDRVRLQLQASF